MFTFEEAVALLEECLGHMAAKYGDFDDLGEQIDLLEGWVASARDSTQDALEDESIPLSDVAQEMRNASVAQVVLDNLRETIKRIRKDTRDDADEALNGPEEHDLSVKAGREDAAGNV